MKEVYRLFVNGNPTTGDEKCMKLRLPTAPMFQTDEYNNLCYYRLNRLIVESADTELDEHTLVVELNIGSRSSITTALTQADTITTALSCETGLITFLAEITGDSDSCKYYNRQVDNACVGAEMWGNSFEIRFYRIALASGVKTRWGADQDVVMEFEIEPIKKHSCPM